MDPAVLDKALLSLLRYVEANEYKGYDLYDGLKITNNSFLLKNRYTNLFFTQVFKRNPVNLRPYVGITKTRMPKAMGLFLDAYSNLIACHPGDTAESNHYKKQGEFLFNWLAGSSLTGYHGPCWNFGFNYTFMMDKPTIVITSIICRGLFNYYQVTKSEKAKELLAGVSGFILKDLHQYENEHGICFSYTPIKKDICFNASMLAAETLAKIYSITHDESLIEPIRRATDFTLAYQKPDGRWNYSIDLNTGVQRPQVDFHQGYVVESLYDIIRYAGLNDPNYREALEKGTAFYFREQFFPSGQSKRRIPRIWPVDIHNQAQGIITFCKLQSLDPAYLEFAKTIANWTIDHMQHPTGYFYYQVHRRYTIRISYMRWAQAWMLLSLTQLQEALQKTAA